MTTTFSRTFAAAAAATALGVAGLAAFGNAPATSQEPATTVQKKEVFSKDRLERQTDIDLGRKGPSPGDRIIARGPLFDATATRRKAGNFTAEIVNFDNRTVLSQFTSTWTFPDGQLVAVGTFAFRRVLSPAGGQLAIVGGTGAYAGASGTITTRVRKIGGDEGFALSFQINTP